MRRTAPRSGLRRLGYFAFRLAVYGLMGVALEVVFYNLVKALRPLPVLGLLFQFDWRVDPALGLEQVWKVPLRSLYGQCSLWMFLVYTAACFAIELLYRKLFTVPWALRALAYGLVIFLWECASGWLLKALTGYEIWYYADAGAFFRMTSLYILPLWVLTGAAVEYLYRQLMDPELVKAIEDWTIEPRRELTWPPSTR